MILSKILSVNETAKISLSKPRNKKRMKIDPTFDKPLSFLCVRKVFNYFTC